MTWPPLDTLLPPPRDDEPRSLRQDLMDEVRDHLQSAYLGELLRVTDPVLAEKNVLARFGDPARVVRQLWFQAMREKIMSQRILVAACLIMAVASMTGVGLMWNLNQQNQVTMARNQKDLIELVNSNQKSNLQFLQTLVTEQKSATTKADPEWCPVKIRCSLGKKGGPPAKGFVISCKKSERNYPPTLVTSELIVPDDGLVDMGVLQIGSYSLSVTSPFDGTVCYETTGILEVLARLPQVPIYGEIICPEALPSDVQIKPHVVWPEGLRDKHLWLLCTFSNQWKQEGTAWNIKYYLKADSRKNLQSGRGGGFGQLDLNQGGVGFCNIEDNLDDHMRPTVFGAHIWQCLINDRGEVWDLGLISNGQIGRVVLHGTDTFGLFFPEYETVRWPGGGSNPRGGQRDFGKIIQQYSELTSGSERVTWPANDLRLERVEISSAPHEEYGSIESALGGREGDSTNIEASIIAHDLLGEFQVQKVAKQEGLSPDNPMVKFRGVEGKANLLEISIPENWQSEIQENYLKKEEFKKALREARRVRSEESADSEKAEDGKKENLKSELKATDESKGNETK